MPLFDTGLPDLNLVAAVSHTTAYRGQADRVNDANQIAFGLAGLFDFGQAARCTWQ